VIPEAVRREVLARDDFHCIAPIVDPDGAGQCHDRWGRAGYNVPIAHLECDHVGQMRMGKAAKTIPSKLVTLCPGHHRGIGEKGGRCWATSHRFDLREYLRAKSEAGLGKGDQLDTTELHWAAFHEAQVADASL
jgi:hypothetical protein